MSIITQTPANVKLFCVDGVGRNGYIFDRSLLASELVPLLDVAFPFNIDTEFVGFPESHTVKPHQTRKRVTTQVRAINAPTGLIMAPSELDGPRHDVAVSGFHPVDYLRLLGFDVSLERDTDIVDGSYPFFEFVHYGHFLLAEILLIVDGIFKKDIKDLIRAKTTESMYIDLRRRLSATQ